MKGQRTFWLALLASPQAITGSAVKPPDDLNTMHTCVLVADEGNVYDLLDRFAMYDGECNSAESRWDYLGVGGVFAGALPLVRRRKLRRLLWFLPRWLTGASVATKSEVDEKAFLEEPPAAMFFQGKLYECPLSEDRQEILKWQTLFRQLFAQIPDGATLQVVDAHS